jgi:chemotaxis protein MotA
VFLAYGFVAPMASLLKQIYEEEAHFYKIIQAVLVAHLHGNAAQISIEIGRGEVPGAMQPSFAKMEQVLAAIPPEMG